MCAISPVHGGTLILTRNNWPRHSVGRASNTIICRNSVAEDDLKRIRRIRHGETKLFAAMRIICRRAHLPKGLAASLTLPGTSALQLCARRRSGGDAIAD